MKRRVLWMRMSLHRAIVCPVIRHKETPPPGLTIVWCTGVKYIAVKEEGIARVTLGIDQGTDLLDELYPLQVSARLVPHLLVVVNPPHPMGPDK